jgi:hypothetical protein
VDLPFDDFYAAIKVPQWGSREKIKESGRSFSAESGKDGHSWRMSSTHTWRSTLSMCRMMERGPKIISSNPPTPRSSHTSNLIMIMGLLFLLHESLITIMLMMIHLPGVIISVGIDLHLGQKPKLGGRYTDISLIYTSYSVGTLYIHVLLSFFFFDVLVLFLLSKTQKDQKYFCCFSLFASLFF